MTPTAQEVAEQIVNRLCKVLVGVHPQATGKKMVPIIADVLTTFAQARERAVWEEAASHLEADHDFRDLHHWCCALENARAFRRRAATAGKDAP